MGLLRIIADKYGKAADAHERGGHDGYAQKRKRVQKIRTGKEAGIEAEGTTGRCRGSWHGIMYHGYGGSGYAAAHVPAKRRSAVRKERRSDVGGRTERCGGST